uniref:Ubiquitin n=1 Tax=Solanum tuberosum TaxID=4113 RepID=M1DT35_SOLTU
MNQSAILQKKGSNPNKAQSPLKNLDFDMQYRSSSELANKFKIKREQLANERNDRAKKEQAPIAHKRKNSEDFIPQQGKSKFLGHKLVIQSSSREEIRTSHIIAGKGQTKQRLFQYGESIQEKGIKLPMNNSRFQTSFKEGVTASVHVTGTTLGNGEVQHDIEDLLNFKQVKRKSVLPSTSIDQFLDKQWIHNEHDIHDLPNCKQVKRKSIIPANSLDQFQKNQGIHIDDEIKRDNHTIANVEFMCAPIINEHNKGLDNLVDQEVLGGDECDVEEEIGIDCSTKVARKKWVMTGLRDAWRQHKQKIKEKFFDKNSNLEDMLAKRPDGMPEHQFRKLIEYWRHPTVQRATKDNNEEPSNSEMFIATHTKTGKEIQVDTQVAIAELQNHQNSGETADDAFKAVFRKEQPGRLRFYGRSVTTSSLKKDEEIKNLKQKHANETTSLKEELRE